MARLEGVVELVVRRARDGGGSLEVLYLRWLIIGPVSPKFLFSLAAEAGPFWGRCGSPLN